MARKDDIQEAIARNNIEQELKRVREENKRYRFICVSASGSFCVFITKSAEYIYNHWYPFRAAVDFFIKLVNAGK